MTDYLEDEVAKKFEDALTDINARVTEQNMLIADKNNEKYLLEVDNWALIGSNSNWSSTNPYELPLVNKKSTLQTLKRSITTAISTHQRRCHGYSPIHLVLLTGSHLVRFVDHTHRHLTVQILTRTI